MGFFSKKPPAPKLASDSDTSLEERLSAPHWQLAFDARGIQPKECTYLAIADGAMLRSRWSGMDIRHVGPAIFGIGGGKIFVFYREGEKIESVTPPLSAVAGVPRARNGQFQVTFFDADNPQEFWFIPGDYETHKAAIGRVLDQTGIRI